MPKPKEPKNAATGMNYRAIPLRMRADGTPDSLDEATRSVEIIAATEQPVMVIDWERYEVVPEILLMSGCRMPATKKVVMLDTHSRWNTSSVIGSCRELRVEGDQLISRAVYSSMPEAEGPYVKMKEGHLTDYSVGYGYNKKDAVYIPEGETGIVDGRTFTGPVKVVRSWQVKEVSACPIGADDLAKARAATPPAYQAAEENEMDQKLRVFLESRGLPVGATEDEAYRYMETLDVKPAALAAPSAPAQRGEEEIRLEAVRAEQGRISEIRSICTHANLAERCDEFIRSNATVEAVRKAAFEHLTTTPATTPGHRGSIEVGADERDKFRAAGEHALLLRAGIAVATLAPGASDLRGYSLSEMAREALRVSGQNYGGDKMQMIGRALTTSDFPTLLGNVANLSVMDGWETAGETWQEWCGVGSVSDFKIHTMARAGETSDLDEIGEDGEYKHGKRDEQKEQYKIVTYGKLFAISRQGIINDELSALTDTPRAHGEAAARKVGDLPYAVLVANAAMGDGVALFHSGSHGNVGSTSVIKDTSVAEAIKLMKLQKDISGKRRLNIRPEFVLAPVTCEGAAEVFFNSIQFGSAVDATTNNPYAGPRFKRIYEPRLDDADVKKWYMAAQKGKTVNVFFLNGNQAPYLETKQGWNVDGVEMKVRIDAGAKAVDWKGLLSNAGG